MKPAELSESATCERRVYENEGLRPLVDLVEGEAISILDVGCGAGANMELLRERGLDCTGLTISPEEAAVCAAKGLRVVVADAGRDLPFLERSFNGILLSHLVEHMADPPALLRRLARLLTDDGRLYVVIPNVVYYKQRYEFARGRFRYADAGLMDRTHLRFFDVHTAAELIEASGFEIIDRRVDGAVPSLGLRKRWPALFGRLDEFALSRLPGMFGYQFIFKAKAA